MAISRYGRMALSMLAFVWTASAHAQEAPVSDNVHGIEHFQDCVRCHTISKDGEHRFGPNLHGLMERGIAAAPGFDYSDALLAKAQSEPGGWTEKSLNAFIAKPHLATPGNDMPYSGLISPHDRADLLAWLLTATSDDSLPASADQPLLGAESGDAARGKLLFRSCRVCHSYKAGAAHKMGPNLFGFLDRPIATAPGFTYAGNLATIEGNWTPDRLDRFLLSKKEFKQGTHRAFKTLRGPLDRADLIAYLATLREDAQ